MLQMESLVQVADNTGARTAKMIGVIGKSGADQAHIGDIITCHIRESIPTASVKKGTVVKAVVVRTAAPIRRDDGSVLRFDSNAVVVIDKDNNPRGTRIFGPVARELREKGFMKIVSLAPEVLEGGRVFVEVYHFHTPYIRKRQVPTGTCRFAFLPLTSGETYIGARDFCLVCFSCFNTGWRLRQIRDWRAICEASAVRDFEPT